MNNVNLQTTQKIEPGINLGHLGIIFLVFSLLLGISYVEKPELFKFKNKQTAASDASVPHYYAYVTPAEDLPKGEVLGASTNQGPSIISDDGTVTPVGLGEVLGASTQDVTLSLESVNVNEVSESAKTVQNYFSSSEKIESESIQSTEIAAALNSGNQNQIDAQAKQIISVRDALQKLPVPTGLVKLQKLKIIQYDTAVQLMQNFTDANSRSDLVNDALKQFLKSQQDLDTENILVAQKYGTVDPYYNLYLNSDGSSAVPQSTIDNFGSGLSTKQTDSSNLTALTNAAQ